MSSLLESEILKTFLENIKNDKAIPASLTESINKLNGENKLLKSTHIKKLIEEFDPNDEVKDESK